MNLFKFGTLWAAIVLALAGCGGGSSGGDDTSNFSNNDDGATPDDTSGTETSTKTLTGTAAAGAPIIGNVIVKGSLGNVVTAPIEADGNYSIDVRRLTAPYMLRAAGTVGGRSYTLHSFAAEASADQTVNITPFTDLIVANAAGQIASRYFESGDFSALSQDEIKAEETALKSKLKTVFQQLGVADTVDLLHTAFSADHSKLDAALDLVRVEVDEQSNIATLTNLVDNTTLHDHIADDSQDDEGQLPVRSDLTAVRDDLKAISERFDALGRLFTNKLPDIATLSPFFADTFTEDDRGKNEFLVDLTSDKSLVGLTFPGTAISDLDREAGTATVSVRASSPQKAPFTLKWQVARQNGEWVILGDQRIADIGTKFQCEHGEKAGAAGWYSCGLNIGVEDNNVANNPGGQIIRAARITLVRNGDPVPGAVLYAGDGNTVGELAIYDEDYADDYIGFGDIPTSDGTLRQGPLSPSLFHDNDIARFELFTSPLDTTGSTPTVTGTAVATYDLPIPKAPIPLAEMRGHAYPIISDDTKAALEDSNRESLTISWRFPANAGLRNSEVKYRVCDADGDCLEREHWRPVGNSVTFGNLDLNAAGVDTLPLNHEIRVYSLDAFGREFTASYQYDSNASSQTGSDGALSIDLTKLAGTTVYEVYFDGEETQGCDAPKSVGRIEFLTNTSFRYAALSGSDAGATGTVDFTANATQIVTTDGATTTFSDAPAGAPYFMTGNWVSGDGTETELNYYFHSEAEANAFKQPGCP